MKIRLRNLSSFRLSKGKIWDWRKMMSRNLTCYGWKLDLWSLEAEKYRVGIIHEFLSLTLEKRALIHQSLRRSLV